MVEHEEAAFQHALGTMAQETKAEGEALRQQAEAAEKLQPLRDEEAARAAVLHRLSVERDALEREEARAKTRQAELETRLAQASRDLAREEEHIAEAEGILRGLGEEARRLEAASSRDHEEPRLREAVMRAAETLAAAELALSEATTALVESRGEGNRLEGEKTRIAERLARSEVEVREIEDELARLEAESGTASMLAGLNAELAQLLAQVDETEAELLAAEAEQDAARALESELRAEASAARLANQEAETELATILKLLAPETAGAWTPIIDEIKVASGYEQALGAALGDDLDAASDEAAPAHWRLAAEGAFDPALPDGATPLGQFANAPKVLARRLAQIGLVEANLGRELQARLSPGQRLVSKDGDLWRWDGYSVQAGTASAAGARLIERSRMETLKRETRRSSGAVDRCRLGALCCVEQGRGDQPRPPRLFVSRPGRPRRRSTGRARRLPLSNTRRRRTARSSARWPRRRRGRGRPGTRRASTLRASPPPCLSSARSGRSKRHWRSPKAPPRPPARPHARAEAALEGFEREMTPAASASRRSSPRNELWQNRIANAREQIATLRAREAETSADLAALANLPAEIEAAARQAARRDRTAAERERGKAADDLAVAETDLKRPREGFARGAGAAGRSA